MLNHIVLMGRLTRDPELRRTQSGLPVASFRLAVDRDFVPKDGGERQADFIDIVAWRNTAEFVSKYFAKGRMAVVSGRLQMREWTDKEGNKRTSAEVVADNVYFGDSRRDSDSQGGGYNQGGYNQQGGCVSFMFDEKGQIIVEKDDELDGEELEMVAIEAGAEDISEEEDSFEIITAPEDFSAVREALENAGIEMAEAEVSMIPQTYTELTDEEDIKKMTRLLDMLDDDDDVKNVYHNWDE